MRESANVYLNDCDTIRFGLDKVEYNFEFVCNRGLDGDESKTIQRPRDEQEEYLFQKIRNLSQENENLKNDNFGIKQKVATLERENSEQLKYSTQELAKIVHKTNAIIESFKKLDTENANISHVDVIAHNLDSIEAHLKDLSNTLQHSQIEVEDVKKENA